jgi:hypothetical protein
MLNDPLDTEQDEQALDLRSAVIAADPTNPTLQRLQRRVLADADASEAITSYDRMHHRHSRA